MADGDRAWEPTGPRPPKKRKGMSAAWKAWARSRQRELGWNDSKLAKYCDCSRSLLPKMLDNPERGSGDFVDRINWALGGTPARRRGRRRGAATRRLLR